MSVRASRPNPPKRTTVGWVAAGLSRRCRTFLRVTLAITPTVCQQHSAAEEDIEEHGQHVRAHALVDVCFLTDGGRNNKNALNDQRVCVC